MPTPLYSNTRAPDMFRTMDYILCLSQSYCRQCSRYTRSFTFIPASSFAKYLSIWALPWIDDVWIGRRSSFIIWMILACRRKAWRFLRIACLCIHHMYDLHLAYKGRTVGMFDGWTRPLWLYHADVMRVMIHIEDLHRRMQDNGPSIQGDGRVREMLRHAKARHLFPFHRGEFLHGAFAL